MKSGPARAMPLSPAVRPQFRRRLPSYNYTLVNPVSITKFDRQGQVLEAIQATRASTSGKLLASDKFAQSSYVRWTTNQYTDCCFLASTRVYHTIPSLG